MSNPEPNPNRPTLNIKIDKSDIEKDQDKKIEQLTRENQAAQETISALLKSEKQKFEESTNYAGFKLPPVGGESPPLEAPKKEVWTMKNFDFENSAVLDMNPKFESTEAAMDYIKKIAENVTVKVEISNE